MVGFGKCEHCRRKKYWDDLTFCCSCNSANYMCEACLFYTRCSKCDFGCCRDCDYKLDCCGLKLCGSGLAREEDEVDECDSDDCSPYNCFGKHRKKTLPCGHRGCNFYSEGCRICKVASITARDALKVDKFVKDVEDPSLKKVLKTWMKNTGKKAVLQMKMVTKTKPEAKKAAKTTTKSKNGNKKAVSKPQQTQQTESELPPGWTKKTTTQQSGKAKGTTYFTWYSPGNHRFRSKAEIQRFLPLLEKCGNKDDAWKESYKKVEG